MKKDTSTQILFTSMITWVLAKGFGIMDSDVSSSIVFVGGLVFIAIMYFIARRFSEPDTDLEFSSYFEPRGHTVNLSKGDTFQLVWIFKNNLNKEIKILSYNIRINLNGEVFRNHNWRPNYTPTIPPRDTVTNFWTERGKGGYGIENPGVYEFQSIVEYQLPNEDKKMAYHSCELKVIG
ncbi:MAG: hypothetical protein KAU52_02725 [Methanosarcinales archaeon]|nr:hypothetical protein [Methanosarcinales archaeon]